MGTHGRPRADHRKITSAQPSPAHVFQKNLAHGLGWAGLRPAHPEPWFLPTTDEILFQRKCSHCPCRHHVHSLILRQQNLFSRKDFSQTKSYHPGAILKDEFPEKTNCIFGISMVDNPRRR